MPLNLMTVLLRILYKVKGSNGHLYALRDSVPFIYSSDNSSKNCLVMFNYTYVMVTQ